MRRRLHQTHALLLHIHGHSLVTQPVYGFSHAQRPPRGAEHLERLICALGRGVGLVGWLCKGPGPPTPLFRCGNASLR
jgi:hypothetical protein